MTRSPTEIVKNEKVEATIGNSENSSTQYRDFEQIHVAILTKLAEERPQFPAHVPKLIHVLPPVDAHIQGQWQERLQLAKKCYNHENIALIPYYAQNSHWLGMILRFNISGQLEQAEFIDPVANSNFNPMKLQMEFSKLFSGVVLKSMTL
ncbi:unnamed protein product [Rotaria sp. Silwood2]|nr:unnamed protein product [Rotaria sp. Silwood2]